MLPDSQKFELNEPSSSFKGLDKEINGYLTEIEMSEQILKKKEEEWKRYVRYFKNDFYEGRARQDRISVNYIYSTIRTAIPQLYFKNAYITVNPRKVRVVSDQEAEEIQTPKLLKDVVTAIKGEAKPEQPTADDRARILESCVNYLFRELDFKKENKKCILDAKIFGCGFLKIGYTFETDLVSKKSDDGRIDYEEKVRKDQIHMYRLSPKQVIIPIGFDELDKMPWIAIKYLKPLDDVKNNKKYKNTDKVVGEKINQRDFYSIDKMQMDYEKSQELFVTIYERWDKRQNKVETFTKNGIKLDEKDWPYKMEGFPVEMLSFNPIPDEFYPISEVKYLEPQNLELNRYRTRQMKHNERFNRKYVVDEAAVDPNEFNKLKLGDDGVIIRAHHPVNNQYAVLPIQDAPMGADNRYMQDDIRQDMRIMSGFDDLQLGAGVRGAQTATEASIVEQSKKLRIDEQADIVQDFVTKVARKVIQLILQFYDKKRVVLITGEAGIPWTPVFSKDEIQGEYDVDVETGSSLPLTEDVRRNQITILMNMLGAPMFAQYVNIPGLLTQVFRAYPQIKNPESYIKTEETNREAELNASKENQLMFMGRFIQPDPKEAHLVHLKSHTRFLDAQPAGTLSEEAVNNFSAHMELHKQFLQQNAVQVNRGGSPIGGSIPNPGKAPSGAMPNMPEGLPMQSIPPQAIAAEQMEAGQAAGGTQ